MEISQAKFDEAVSFAKRIKDAKYEVGGMVFQAANAILDESQPQEIRISNAEGYLQHSKVRQDFDAYKKATDNTVAENVQHFSDIVRTLSKQTQ